MFIHLTKLGILRLPFRSFHENYGYSESIDVKYLAEIDREYAKALEAENQERSRRIEEFEEEDVDQAYDLASLIQESKICIPSPHSPFPPSLSFLSSVSLHFPSSSPLQIL